jgi:hypothetical protein
MRSLRLVLVCVVIALFLAACDGDNETSAVADNPPPEFRAFVQFVLTRDVNSEPVPVNDRIFEEQFADGEPEPVDVFL